LKKRTKKLFCESGPVPLQHPVMPAEAGIHALLTMVFQTPGTPGAKVFCGAFLQKSDRFLCASRKAWMAAFAAMTVVVPFDSPPRAVVQRL
jgi:hypothetical protein